MENTLASEYSAIQGAQERFRAEQEKWHGLMATLHESKTKFESARVELRRESMLLSSERDSMVTLRTALQRTW